MAAQQTFKDVRPDYLRTILVQRCELDEASMGSAIPMDAGAVETAAADDAGSLGQCGVGPGLGKGGPPRTPVAPTRKFPPGGTLGWQKYDCASNNGFPPSTCGGCGADSLFRNDCADKPHKGKFPPAKAKAKARAIMARGERGKMALEE